MKIISFCLLVGTYGEAPVDSQPAAISSEGFDDEKNDDVMPQCNMVNEKDVDQAAHDEQAVTMLLSMLSNPDAFDEKDGKITLKDNDVQEAVSQASPAVHSKMQSIMSESTDSEVDLGENKGEVSQEAHEGEEVDAKKCSATEDMENGDEMSTDNMEGSDSGMSESDDSAEMPEGDESEMEGDDESEPQSEQGGESEESDEPQEVSEDGDQVQDNQTDAEAPKMDENENESEEMPKADENESEDVAFMQLDDETEEADPEDQEMSLVHQGSEKISPANRRLMAKIARARAVMAARFRALRAACRNKVKAYTNYYRGYLRRMYRWRKYMKVNRAYWLRYNRYSHIYRAHYRRFMGYRSRMYGIARNRRVRILARLKRREARLKNHYKRVIARRYKQVYNLQRHYAKWMNNLRRRHYYYYRAQRVKWTRHANRYSAYARAHAKKAKAYKHVYQRYLKAYYNMRNRVNRMNKYRVTYLRRIMGTRRRCLRRMLRAMRGKCKGKKFMLLSNEGKVATQKASEAADEMKDQLALMQRQIESKDF